MEHFEAVYLLSMAHRIRGWEDEAEAQGGTFHPTSNFVPLKDGLQAQARIQRIGGQPLFAVIVRQPRGDTDDAKVLAAARGLFLTNFERVPKVIDAPLHRDHLFFSREIPPDPLGSKST